MKNRSMVEMKAGSVQQNMYVPYFKKYIFYPFSFIYFISFSLVN